MASSLVAATLLLLFSPQTQLFSQPPLSHLSNLAAVVFPKLLYLNVAQMVIAAR